MTPQLNFYFTCINEESTGVRVGLNLLRYSVYFSRRDKIRVIPEVTRLLAVLTYVTLECGMWMMSSLPAMSLHRRSMFNQSITISLRSRQAQTLEALSYMHLVFVACSHSKPADHH